MARVDVEVFGRMWNEPLDIHQQIEPKGHLRQVDYLGSFLDGH